MSFLSSVFWQTWQVLSEIAPYLLLGFAIAGLLSIWLSAEWIQRHLGGRGLGPVLKASALGIPLPLCSCSVIPVAASMRRHGASRAATTSFLLSTPQTGVDSIAVTYALLGPVFAVFRPLAALISGLIGGVLVLLFGEKEATKDDGTAEVPACTDSCCHGDARQSALLRAMRYGFVTLPRDLAFALLVGVVLAGLMSSVIEPGSLKNYLGGDLKSIILLMIAAIPIYVCATASVPIAAALIMMGASPGAAFAFLVVGAATNPATFTTLWKVLGRRTAILYLVTVALSALVCWLLVNQFVSPGTLPKVAGHAHHHMAAHGSVWSNIAAFLLLGVLGYSVYAGRKSRAKAAPAIKQPAAAEAKAACCCCSHGQESRAN